MIVACGFKSDKRVGISFENFVKEIKTIGIHVKITFIDKFHGIIKDSIIKLIFGNINTDEKVKRIGFHEKLLLILFLCPKLNLPFNRDFGVKSTNRNFWDGGQTPIEAFMLIKNAVLCPLFFFVIMLYFIIIKYKYHIYS